MSKVESAFIGIWRIVEMELWDADYFDMEVPAYIRIDENLTGEFQFGLVQGDLDGRMETFKGALRFAFSWSGSDENDAASGRGGLRSRRRRGGGPFLFSPGR